eukprot:257962_1
MGCSMKSCLKWTVVTMILSIAIIYQYSLNTYSASLDEDKLSDTYAIITGSSAGIGEEMSYQFCKAKANVIIAGTNINKLQKVKSKCKSLGAKSINFIAISLDSLSNCIQFADKALIFFKETNTRSSIQLDYLMLNHATIPPIDFYLHPNATYNPDQLNNILKRTEFAYQVNTLSYINLATLFYDYLQQSNGRIVISNSAAGRIPMPKTVVYASNKFALNGFFESWRKELIANSKSNVSITICIIGLIGTEKAKENLANVNLRIPKLFVQEFANVTTTARDIIAGGQKRLKTVHTPFSDISLNLAIYHYASTFTDMLIQYIYFGYD